jgi:hypothetical protein
MTDAAKAFTRRQFDAMRGALSDHEMPPRAFKMLFAIVDSLNRETNRTPPGRLSSLSRLGRKIGVKWRQAQRLAEELEERGHILVSERKNGVPSAFALPPSTPTYVKNVIGSGGNGVCGVPATYVRNDIPTYVRNDAPITVSLTVKENNRKERSARTDGACGTVGAQSQSMAFADTGIGLLRDDDNDKDAGQGARDPVGSQRANGASCSIGKGDRAGAQHAPSAGAEPGAGAAEGVPEAPADANAPGMFAECGAWAAVGDVIAAAGAHLVPGAANGKRLPFSHEVITHIARMGVDLIELIERYHVKTKGKKIVDPSAYLLRMAQGEAAKAAGVTIDTIKRVTSGSRESRAQAYAAAVGIGAEPGAKYLESYRRRLKLRGLDPEARLADWRKSREGQRPFASAAAAEADLSGFDATREFEARRQGTLH